MLGTKADFFERRGREGFAKGAEGGMKRRQKEEKVKGEESKTIVKCRQNIF
jgi:hypothetical protein